MLFNKNLKKSITIPNDSSILDVNYFRGISNVTCFYMIIERFKNCIIYIFITIIFSNNKMHISNSNAQFKQAFNLHVIMVQSAFKFGQEVKTTNNIKL